MKKDSPTEFERFLLSELPQYESPIKIGRINNRKLSRALKISRPTLHKSLKNGKIRGKYVNRLCRISENRLTQKKLLPFIIFD